MTTLPTPGPWHRAAFLSRPNRFVVHARLDTTGQEVRTHLPDPGRLGELMLPGATVWLKPATTPRKTAWSTIYVESPGGSLVCCDTRRPNLLLRKALEDQSLDELADWTLVRTEAAWGSSRFDFELARGDDRMLVEAKGVSWIEGGRARFPDAVTARGTRHLRELAELARGGGEASAIFVMQRSDRIDAIEAARERDPAFADALGEARAAGVVLLGRRTTVTLDRTTLGPAVPVL